MHVYVVGHGGGCLIFQTFRLFLQEQRIENLKLNLSAFCMRGAMKSTDVFSFFLCNPICNLLEERVQLEKENRLLQGIC